MALIAGVAGRGSFLGKRLLDKSPRAKMLVYKIGAEIAYRFRTRFRASRMPEVLSIEATLARILTTDVSVIRFGDGEMTQMHGGSIRFQPASPALEAALLAAIRTDDERLLVCLPDVFAGMRDIVSLHRNFWVRHLFSETIHWLTITDRSRTYGSSFISRPYMPSIKHDTRRTRQIFDRWKSVWLGRPVILVEGEFTRFGVGNDLLAHASSVRRVICPASDAFSRVGEILAACLTLEKNALYLLALGPTAKPLAVALMHSGRRAIDIGHLDIEYEWYLRALDQASPVPGKAVNEAGTMTADPVDERDPYHRQIVAQVR